MSLLAREMVLTARFDPGEVLHLIAQEGGTILNGFDTHFHALTTHPDCEQTDLAVSAPVSLPPAWRAANLPRGGRNACCVPLLRPGA